MCNVKTLREMEYYRRRPKRRRRSSAGDDDDDGDVVSLSETLDLVKHAKRVLVFTGAGISVEAGISRSFSIDVSHNTQK